MNPNKICGVILAGGKSSRMGTNKAHLKIQEQDFLAYSHQLLAASNIETILVSGDYANYQCVLDSKPFQGPAAAILSVWNTLQTSTFEKLVICAVDMPFITPYLIEILINSTNNYEAAYFKNNYLPCCINTNALEKIKKINFDQKPLQVFLNHFVVNALEIPISQRSYFFNINTPAEFQDLQEKCR